MPVVGEYAVAHFGQRRLMCLLDFLHGENHISAIRACGGAQISNAQAENIIQQAGSIPQFRKWLIGLYELGLSGHKIEFLGQFFDWNSAGAPDFIRNLRGKRVAKLFSLLLLQLRLNGGLHLVKGLSAGSLSIDDLDDVEAVLRLHQVRGGAFWQAECRSLKFGYGLSANDPVQIAAFILGGVFRILLGQVGEFRAMLRFIQDILCFGLDFGDLGIGFADGLEQNVRDMRAIFQFVAVNMLLIIDFFVVLGYLGALPKLREIKSGVINRPALGNNVPRLVFLEIGAQLGVGSFNLGLQIVRLDQDVIEFNLFIGAQIFRPHLIVGNRDAVSHELLKLLLQHLFFYLRLEFRNAHLETGLDFGRIFVHADKRVTGKRRGNYFSEQVSVFLVGDPHTQAFRFQLQAAFENQLVQRLSRVQRQDAAGNLSIARNAIQLGLNIGGCDGLVAHLGHNVSPGNFVAGLLRHQIQEHADRYRSEEDSKQNPHTKFLFTNSVPHVRQASRATPPVFYDLTEIRGLPRPTKQRVLL